MFLSETDGILNFATGNLSNTVKKWNELSLFSSWGRGFPYIHQLCEKREKTKRIWNYYFCFFLFVWYLSYLFLFFSPPCPLRTSVFKNLWFDFPFFEMGKVGIWWHDFDVLEFNYLQVDVPEVLTLSVDSRKGHKWRIIDFSEENL